MRRPRYLDMICPDCQTKHERFCETNDDGTPLQEEHCDRPLTAAEDGEDALTTCGATCGGVLVLDFTGNAPLVAPLAGKDVKNNLDDAQRQRERLEKRSSEHFHKKGGRDEAIERERAMLKKNGMEGAGGVW